MDFVQERLKRLVAEYGPCLALEPKRIFAMLLDNCVAHQREVRLLTIMVKEGLTNELMRDRGEISATIALPRMVDRLYDEFGIDRELATWAVNTWADILGWNSTTSVKATPAHARIPERPTTGTVHRDRLQDGTQAPEMVFIRGGTFNMGSPENEKGRGSNERQHQVSVGDVWIGRYAVTFDEYDRFARATGRDLPRDEGWGRGRRPVINVSWSDATAYAEWLSGQTGQRYRLPTEAEWEYTARAGTTKARYWGKAIGRNQANCRSCGSQWDGKQTAPVGSFAPNAWGLYDMLGNVWEWTCSRYDENYSGAEQRCDASGQSRSLRGSSWLNVPDWVRSAVRIISVAPGSRSNGSGFRLARSP